MIIDLHAHLPMSLPLPEAPQDSIATHELQRLLLKLMSSALNEHHGHPRVTVENIKEGGVAALGSVLYNPADEFQLGHDPGKYSFAHTLIQIDEVEQAVKDTCGLAVVRNPRELEACLVKGEQALFHCVEGGFCIENDAGHATELARRGIAYVIVAHLFFKNIATCNNAIPFIADEVFARINNQPTNKGLTEIGHQLVETLFKEHVIVDVTHCSDLAINDIFALRASKREYGEAVIISSHTGVRSRSNHPLNLSSDTVDRIVDSGGVIGVIFYPYWLIPESESERKRNRLQQVAETIDCIHAQVGNYDHIAIGTDLAGFIRPIKECPTMANIQAVEDFITQRYGLPIAEKILWNNVLQTLQRGWQGI